MATSYTSLLGLALPVTGELSGTWGDTVNNYITNYLDAAVAGVQIISGSQTAVTLSVTNGSSLVQVGAGATGSAQYGIIRCSGNPASLLTITAPAASKSYLIINATSTSQSVKIVGTGPTTGVTLVSGESAVVAWNGTDFIKVSSSAVDGVSTFSAGTTGFTPSTATSGAVTLAGTLATTNGGTGLTSFTANGVVYASSSSALTTGSALTFDGSTLGLGNAPTTYKFEITTSGNNGLKLNAGTAGADQLYLGNTAGVPAIGTISNSSLTFIQNGSEQMRLTSTGLGIGTSSPSQPLTVGGSGNILVSSGATFFSSGRLYIRAGSGQSLDFGANDANSLMQLSSSGNLGLGVTPSAWGGGTIGFEVNTGSAFSGYYAGGVSAYAVWGNAVVSAGSPVYKINGKAFQQTWDSSSGAVSWNIAGSGTAGNAITFTQAMTLDASGNLLVGTTSTDAKLHVTNGASPASRCIVGGGGGAANTLYTVLAGGNNIQFETNGSERARITSGGYFKASNDGTYVGSTASYHELRVTGAAGDWNTIFANATATAANAYGIRVSYTGSAPNGTGNAFLNCDDTGATRFVARSNGGLANYSANDVNLSDRREKTNFAPAKSYLDTICAIPVQTFNYIDQSEDDPGLTLGVVAQDVQAVAPELVMESNWGTEDNPKMRLSIYQTDLQYALMKALQELKSELDSVKAELATLKGA